MPVQGKPVDQQGGEQDHPSDATFAQHRPSSRGYRQQHQRGLGGDGIVVVPVSHQHVHTDEQQEQATEGLHPDEAPSIQLDCESVRDLHRDDHPGHSEQLHRRIRDPALPERETHSGQQHQYDGRQQRRQRQPGLHPDGAVDEYHRDHQGPVDPPLSLNGNLGHDVPLGGGGDATVPLHRPPLIATWLLERVVELPESLVNGLRQLLSTLLLITLPLGDLDVTEIDVD